MTLAAWTDTAPSARPGSLQLCTHTHRQAGGRAREAQVSYCAVSYGQLARPDFWLLAWISQGSGWKP